jgi:lysine 6-dehydrogenase
MEIKMADHTFLILGAGRMGQAIAHYLSRYGRVLVHDENAVARTHAVALAAKPTNVSEVPDCQDISQPSDSVNRALERADVVISALPAHENRRATALAIGKGKPYLDLGGVDEIVTWQKQQMSSAPIIPDCGLAPGLTPAIAYSLVQKQGGRAESVRLYCGGITPEPDSQLGWTRTWSVAGLINEYQRPALIIVDGEPTEVQPLDEVESIELTIHSGTREPFEACATHGGAGNLATLLRGNVRHLAYKTLRWPGFAAKMRALLSAFSPAEVEKIITAIAPECPDRVVFAIGVDGQVVVGQDFGDEQFTAMQRLTALPAAAVARLIADGAVTAPGFLPVELVPIDALLAYLSEAGLPVADWLTRSRVSPSSFMKLEIED